MFLGRSIGFRRLGVGICLLAVFTTADHPALAQSAGNGSSPGRAAYRPAGEWNNGPFYTAPHVDPYAPRAGSSSGLIASDPSAPPYSSEPRGKYGDAYPESAPLRQYEQGFSPYSGYANWYKQTYGVDPTEKQLAQASAAYFRSSPVGPNVRTLAPSVSQAIAAQSAPAARRTAAAAKARTATETLPPPRVVRTPNGPTLYRGPR